MYKQNIKMYKRKEGYKKMATGTRSNKTDVAHLRAKTVNT